MVPKELSVLSSKMATVCKAQQKRGKRPVGVSIDKLLCADQLERVRAMWSAFTPDARPSDDTCAWRSGLRPLLRLLMKHQGSHVVPRSLVHAMREAVDGVARAAWLVYSADGKTPPPEGNPLHGCPSPSRVSRTHLDPVFMAQGPNLEVDPRGCIVGILPFQLRQVLVLLQGAHLKNVKPQVVRNEGGMNRSPNLHRTLPFSTILAHRTHIQQNTTKQKHTGCAKNVAGALASLHRRIFLCGAHKKKMPM